MGHSAFGLLAVGIGNLLTSSNRPVLCLLLGVGMGSKPVVWATARSDHVQRETD